MWNGLATALSLAPPCHAKPFVQSTLIDPNKGAHLAKPTFGFIDRRHTQVYHLGPGLESLSYI